MSIDDDLEFWYHNPTVQTQMTALLLKVRMEVSEMFFSSEKVIWLLEKPTLFCCVTLHSWNAVLYIQYHHSLYGGGYAMNWDRCLFILILLALSLTYSCFSLTGSMPWTVTEWSQPSSVFSVRSKRRQVSFYFTSSLCSSFCTSCNLVLRYSVSWLV